MGYTFFLQKFEVASSKNVDLAQRGPTLRLVYSLSNYHITAKLHAFWEVDGMSFVTKFHF